MPSRRIIFLSPYSDRPSSWAATFFCQAFLSSALRISVRAHMLRLSLRVRSGGTSRVVSSSMSAAFRMRSDRTFLCTTLTCPQRRMTAHAKCMTLPVGAQEQPMVTVAGQAIPLAWASE